MVGISRPTDTPTHITSLHLFTVLHTSVMSEVDCIRGGEERSSASTQPGAVYKGPVFKGDVYKGDVFKGDVFKGNVYKGNVYKGNVYEGKFKGTSRNFLSSGEGVN